MYAHEVRDGKKKGERQKEDAMEPRVCYVWSLVSLCVRDQNTGTGIVCVCSIESTEHREQLANSRFISTKFLSVKSHSLV